MTAAANRPQDRIDSAWAALDDVLRWRCDLVRREFDLDATDVHDAARAVAGFPDGAGPTAARAQAENELSRCLAAIGRDRIDPKLALGLADADLRITIAGRIYNDTVESARAARRFQRRHVPRRFDLVEAPGSFAITTIRQTARVLAVDPDGRALLMRYHDPANGPVWITPGGGVEPGESLRSGAVRELLEETGIEARPAELTGPVWFRRATLSWNGRRVEAHEWYYLLRTSHTTVDSSGFTTAETAFVEPPRWWDLTELAADDRIVPVSLTQALPELVSEVDSGRWDGVSRLIS